MPAKQVVLVITVNMQAFTPIIKAQISQLTGRRMILRSLQVRQTRNVVFARGERVRGMIRDPEDILTSQGHKYGITQENLKPLKEFLGDDYKLPDKLLLQVITHKSFAHGTKPYNEKLSFLGEELLKYTASKYAIGTGSKATNYDFSVGNYNFDSLGSLAHRLMVTDKTLSEFAADKGLDKVFFCKVAVPQGSQEKGVKPKAMYSTITSSLVGAIALQHGKKAAEKFIEESVFADVLPLVKKVRGN